MAWHLQNDCRTTFVDGDQEEKGFDDKGNRQFRKGFRSKWLLHPERMKVLFVGAIPLGSNNGKRQVALA